MKSKAKNDEYSTSEIQLIAVKTFRILSVVSAALATFFLFLTIKSEVFSVLTISVIFAMAAYTFRMHANFVKGFANQQELRNWFVTVTTVLTVHCGAILSGIVGITQFMNDNEIISPQTGMLILAAAWIIGIGSVVYVFKFYLKMFLDSMSQFQSTEHNLVLDMIQHNLPHSDEEEFQIFN